MINYFKSSNKYSANKGYLDFFYNLQYSGKRKHNSSNINIEVMSSTRKRSSVKIFITYITMYET